MIYVSLVIVHTVPVFCQKGDFFPKRMEGIFVYVFEFRLTFDKKQNISTLMRKSSKSEGRARLKLFKLFIMCALN